MNPKTKKCSLIFGIAHEVSFVLWPLVILLMLLLYWRYNAESLSNTTELFHSLFLGELLWKTSAWSEPHGLVQWLGALFSYALERARMFFEWPKYSLILWMRLIALLIGSMAIPVLGRLFVARTELAPRINVVIYLMGQLAFISLTFRLATNFPGTLQFAFFPWFCVLVLQTEAKSKVALVVLSCLWANLHYSAIAIPILFLCAVFVNAISLCLPIIRLPQFFVRNLLLATLAQLVHPRFGLQLIDIASICLNPPFGDLIISRVIPDLASPRFRSFPEIAMTPSILLICCYYLKASLKREITFLCINGIMLLLVTSAIPALGIVITCAVLCVSLTLHQREQSCGDDLNYAGNASRLQVTNLSLTVGFAISFVLSAIILHLVTVSISEPPIYFEALPMDLVASTQKDQTPSTRVLVDVPYAAEALYKGIDCLISTGSLGASIHALVDGIQDQNNREKRIDSVPKLESPVFGSYRSLIFAPQESTLARISQAFPSRAGQESVKYESAQVLSGDGVLKHIEVDNNEQTPSLPAIGSRSRNKLEKCGLDISQQHQNCSVIPPITQLIVPSTSPFISLLVTEKKSWYLAGVGPVDTVRSRLHFADLQAVLLKNSDLGRK